MSQPKPPKKSESLEIRIPFETKTAFMVKCREDGRSASEALRAFIEGQLNGPTVVAPRRRLRLVLGAMIAAAIGAAAAPSVALSSPRTAFERLDANGDRRISPEEFTRGVAVEVRFSTGATSLGAPADRPAEAGVRSQLLRDEFVRLDANGDGMISFDEYRRRR